MINILNWPDYRVISVIELEHNYQIRVERAEPPTHCNHPEFVGFGRQVQVITDIPINDKQTNITLNRRRYRCRSCRKTFLEPAPHRDEKRNMTHRLVQYIQRESQRRTFTGIAREVGVTEKTIRNIFNDYCAISKLQRGHINTSTEV